MKDSNNLKTSRRSFTKTIAAAIASIPVFSAVVAEGKQGHAADTLQDKSGVNRTSPQGIKTHDTPPPVEISDGSLRIDINENIGSPDQANGRFVYRLSQRPHIEHIRVLKGNGDKIYEDLTAERSSIDIEWRSDTPPVGGVLKIRGGNFFEIDSDQRFPAAQAGPGRRQFRYQHGGPSSGAARRFRIESVEITDPTGAKTRFSARPTGTGDNFLGEEYRILVWRD